MARNKTDGVISSKITADASPLVDELKRADSAVSRFVKSAQKGTGDLSKGLQSVEGPVGGIAKRFEGLSGIVGRGAGAFVGYGAAVAGAALIVKQSVQELETFERQQLKIEQQLRSTGYAAGINSAELERQARSVALNTLQSVEGVQKAQQILLSYRNVQGEVFKDAVKLSQDMAASFGGGIEEKAKQLGKALEVPTKGIEALFEAGVSFTEQEKEQIRILERSGRVVEAQGILLEKLRASIGGSGTAEAGGLSGAADTLGQRWSELLQAFAKTSGAGDATAKWLNTIAEGLNNVRGSLRPTVEELRNTLAELEAEQSKFSNGPRRMAINFRIKEVTQELLELQAQQGDIESINRLLDVTSQKIAKLENTIATESTDRLFGKSIRKKREAELAELQERSAQLEVELQKAEEIERTSYRTRLEIWSQQQYAAKAAADKEAETAQQRIQKEQAANAKVVDMTRARLDQIYQARLEAEGREAELENLRYQRQLQSIERERQALIGAGMSPVEVRETVHAAIENAEVMHNQRMAAIQMDAQKERDTVVEAARSRYEQLHTERLLAEGREAEIENLRYARLLETIERDRLALINAGVAREEAMRQSQTALEDAEIAHQQKLEAIRKAADEKRMAQQGQTMSKLVGLAERYSQARAAGENQYVAVGLRAAKMFFDEKKKLTYKEAYMNAKAAVVKAWNSAPFPANVPAVALVTAKTAVEMADIAGIAHGGLNNVPRESTYLLDKGERVVSPRQNQDLTGFLAQQKSGRQGGPISVVINNNGSPVDVVGTSTNAEQTEIIIELAEQRIAEGIGRGNGIVATAIESIYAVDRGTRARR